MPAPANWSNARSPRSSARERISTNGCSPPSATISWPPCIRSGKIFGLALVDLTTGDFLATELESEAALLTELQRLRPAEIIYPAEAAALQELLCGSALACAAAKASAPISAASAQGWMLNGYDDWVFAPETALFTVRDHFKVATLDGFGLKDRPAAIGAAGAVLHYLTQHLRRDVASLTRGSRFITQRISGARLHHAAAPGDARAAAP